MRKYRQTRTMVTAVLVLFALGLGLTATSAVYQSSFLAIVGVAIIFWGAILLYILPSKHVPITFLTAATTSHMSNLERILSELKFTEKGIYLPPKNLPDPVSSLIFIPKTAKQSLPKPDEAIMTGLFSEKHNGLFLTPLGFDLSKILEQKQSYPFTKTDLRCMLKKFSKLLTEELEITENIEIQTQNNKIILEMSGSIFAEDYKEAQFPQTHNAIGCLFSSSIACALAKATGKAIVIENEERGTDGKTTKIEYQIVEE